jgi:serine/threonine protein phosphatase PrpC
MRRDGFMGRRATDAPRRRGRALPGVVPGCVRLALREQATTGSCFRLTRDHTVLEDHRRGHPDATPGDLERLPDKHLVTRALGRSGSIEADLSTERVLVGDRVLLAGEALRLALDDRVIADIVSRHGLEKDDLEAAVNQLAERAAASPGRPEVTVILLGFVQTER